MRQGGENGSGQRTATSNPGLFLGSQGRTRLAVDYTARGVLVSKKIAFLVIPSILVTLILAPMERNWFQAAMIILS